MTDSRDPSRGFGPLSTREHEGSGPAKERTSRLARAVAAGFVLKPISLLQPVLLVPIYLKTLGPEGFGALETISAVTAWLGVASLGVPAILTNRLSRALADGDEVKAGKELTLASWSVLLAGLVAIALWLAYAVLTPWRHLFGIGRSISDLDLRLAVVGSGLCVILGAWASIIQAVFAARQQLDRWFGWDAAAKIVTFAVIWVIAQKNLGSLTLVVLVTLGIPLAATVMAGGAVDSRGVLSRVSVQSMPPSGDLFMLWRESLPFAVLQLEWTLVFQVHRVIGAVTVGAAEVAAFAVLAKFLTVAFAGVLLVINPLWPAYTEALYRGETKWVRTWMNRTAAGSAVSMVLFGVGAGFLCRSGLLPRIEKLSGQFSISLIFGTSLLYGAWAWQTAHGIVLNSAGRIRPQIAAVGIQMTLSGCLAFLLARHLGVAGAVWGTVIGTALTAAWWYPRTVRASVFKSIEKEPSRPGSGSQRASGDSK